MPSGCSSSMSPRTSGSACGGPAGGGTRRRARVALHLAPARHLLRLHDHRLRPDLLVVAIKSHSITGGEDGLLKIARLPADLGVASFDLNDNIALYYFVLVVFACGDRAVAAGAFALRPRAFGDPPERDPRRPSRLPCVALQGGHVHALGGALGACRRPVRDGAACRVPGRDEPASLRLHRHDDAGRRRHRQLLGTGDRRVRLPDRPRCDRRLTNAWML